MLVIHFQRLHMISEILKFLLSTMLVAVPQQPLDTAERLEQTFPFSLIVMGGAAGVLFKHGQPHGYMKPVEHMLGYVRDALCQTTDFFAAIGEEGYILIGLETLTLEQIEEPLRFKVVAVDHADVTRFAIFRHGTPDDELEVSLSLVPVPNVSSIESDHDTPFRDRQSGPFRRTAVDEAGPFLSQFRVGSFGDAKGMLPDSHGIGTRRDRQDIGEQFGCGGIRYERRPPRLQVQSLGRDMIREKLSQGRY